MNRALAIGLALAAPLPFVVACSAVLGMDAPHLDPCEHGGCDDGGPGVDAAVDAGGSRDAQGDDGAPPMGVRCGAPGEATYCIGQTPACCATFDAGPPSYACAASGACAGYPIACTSNADCNGTSVCCHYNSGMKCVGQTTCPNANLVCEPSGPADQCPQGWSCKGTIVIGDAASPYLLCAP